MSYQSVPGLAWTGLDWLVRYTALTVERTGAKAAHSTKAQPSTCTLHSRSLPRRGVCSDTTRNGASTEIHRTATRCVQQMEKNKMTTTTEKHERSASLSLCPSDHVTHLPQQASHFKEDTFISGSPSIAYNPHPETLRS